MAISTNCCLNMSPPPPCSTSDSSIISTNTRVSWPRENLRSWKSRCVLGLTCMMILGLESSDFVPQENAMARSMQSDVGSKTNGVKRWSDKRSCEPWRVNSLETIVPENLPRPSARQQWKRIGLLDEAAPLVKDVPRTSGGNSCFHL